MMTLIIYFGSFYYLDLKDIYEKGIYKYIYILLFYLKVNHKKMYDIKLKKKKREDISIKKRIKKRPHQI